MMFNWKQNKTSFISIIFFNKKIAKTSNILNMIKICQLNNEKNFKKMVNVTREQFQLYCLKSRRF